MVEVDMAINDQEMMLHLNQGYEPGLFDWVDITHINNPNSFFVRPVKFNQILIDLEKIVPINRPHRFNMHKCVVFTEHAVDAPAQYLRGQIVGRDHSQTDSVCFNIFAVDYGFICRSVPSIRIWNCRASVLDHAPLAFQCKLANCSPMDCDEWSEESIRTLIDCLSVEKTKMTIVGITSTKLIVQMTNSSPNQNRFVGYRAPTPPPPPEPEVRGFRSG